MDYIIDNAGPDGNGTLEHPWSDVRRNINDLSPGDRLLIRGGVDQTRIYTERKILVRVRGTQEQGIVVMPYEGERVCFSPVRKTEPIFEFDEGACHVRLQEIEIDGQKMGRACVVVEGGAHHISLVDCEIHSVHYDAVVWIRDGDHTLIENCHIYDAYAGKNRDAHGILITEGKHVVIRECAIHDCHGDCVQLINDVEGAGGGLRIFDCHLWTELGGGSENAVDLKTGDPKLLIVIEGNRMHGFRRCGGGGGGTGDPMGAAVRIGFSAVNVVVKENEIWDCLSGIVLVNVEDIGVHDNVIHDLTSDPRLGFETALQVFECESVSILGNEFRDCPERVLTFIRSTAQLWNNRFIRTNAIYREGSVISMDGNTWEDCVDVLGDPEPEPGPEPQPEPELEPPAGVRLRIRGESGLILASAYLVAGRTYRIELVAEE